MVSNVVFHLNDVKTTNNMHGKMPQDLLNRSEVLKKCRKKFDCFLQKNAFYKGFIAKS